MLEILLRTGAKTAAGGEHNRDEKGIALIMLNNSSGFAFALFFFQLSMWTEVRKVAILVFEASRVH